MEHIGLFLIVEQRTHSWSEPEMNAAELEKKWNEKSAETFKQFVTEEIGWDEQARPKCYGTGDGHTYCSACLYKTQC
jgi:hypothetical protein